MTTNDAARRRPSSRRPRPGGRVDFTLMYAAHDAFHRDLRQLAAGGRAPACLHRQLTPSAAADRWLSLTAGSA
ncbi:MAG TPA: hypothetical protein VMV92_00835 [Streptosporangiaceae bacterium]|nr:hypothetical protein [Streptosporangiaceae bacterium]